MNYRNLMYIAISIVCIFSIGVGIYAQVTPKENIINTNINTSNKNVIEEPETTQEDIKRNFNNIFDNKFYVGQYNTTNIERFDKTKEIVYTAYELDEKEGKYDVNIAIPVININGEVTKNFNNTTQDVFANKANEIFGETTVTTIYTVTYTGYINEDIMSVIIKSTLKEGSSAQRVIVQTYNYNLRTGKEATIGDLIEQRGTTEEEVSKKIKGQIEQAIKESNDIQISGYEVYSRDIDDDMYNVENVSTCYLGEDGTLYIVYAYGNEEFTSEMDIIEI